MPDHGGASLPVGGRHGRYEILGALGAGGMGIVLEGRDPELARRVAIKILHPEHAAGADGTEAAARLTREARAMAQLAHPNVVTVYEVGWSAGRAFVAMELIEGTTLRGWLAARPRGWRELVTMFVAAGRGLAAAHAAGLVHRDFKPDNVLIGRDGRPRVADFGLAAMATIATAPITAATALLTTRTTRAGIAGTPAYMAPEQWRGGPIDPRTDQFAFGVALWEALHGERPFAGDDLERATCAGQIATPRRAAPTPRWLDALVRRMLAVDAAARWPTLAAALDRLERRLRRRRWGVVAGAATIGAAAALALAVGTARRSEPEGAALIERARLDAARAWIGLVRAEAARDRATPAAALTCTDDLAELTRALAAAESVLGAHDPLIADPLVRLARCHLTAGRWQPAIAAAARVLALPVRGLDVTLRLHARYLHGRARHAAGIDRAAALADVEATRAEMLRARVTDRLDLDAWLAAQR